MLILMNFGGMDAGNFFINVLKLTTNANISYPSSAGSVVFGVYFSARAAYRLDPEDSGPAIRPCV